MILKQWFSDVHFSYFCEQNMVLGVPDNEIQAQTSAAFMLEEISILHVHTVCYMSRNALRCVKLCENDELLGYLLSTA